MILPDINVWLGLAHPNHPCGVESRNWYQQIPLSETIAFCRQTQLGFLRNSSNPKVTKGPPLMQDEVWTLYDQFYRDPRIVFLDEPAGVETTLRRFANGHQNTIYKWSDAYLAAFAVEIQSQLVTFDKGYHQYPGVNLLVLP